MLLKQYEQAVLGRPVYMCMCLCVWNPWRGDQLNCAPVNYLTVLLSQHRYIDTAQINISLPLRAALSTCLPTGVAVYSLWSRRVSWRSAPSPIRELYFHNHNDTLRLNHHW